MSPPRKRGGALQEHHSYSERMRYFIVRTAISYLLTSGTVNWTR